MSEMTEMVSSSVVASHIFAMHSQTDRRDVNHIGHYILSSAARCAGERGAAKRLHGTLYGDRLHSAAELDGDHIYIYIVCVCMCITKSYPINSANSIKTYKHYNSPTSC